MTVVAVLDVGGSSIKRGVVFLPRGGTPEVRYFARTSLNSHGTADEIAVELAQAAHAALMAAPAPAGLAIGFPAPFDYATGICRMRDFGKFDSLYGVDVKQLLLRSLRHPIDIRFRNDAEAFAIGKAHFGAGIRFSRLLCLTLGTSPGSSFIVDGDRVLDDPSVPPNGELNLQSFGGQNADEVFSTRGLEARLGGYGR